MTSKILPLIVSCLLLGGCVGDPHTLPQHVASDDVAIAPNVSLHLPPAAELGKIFEVTQLVTAKYGDQTFAFEAHISATPERYHVVGLDMMGRRIITIDFDADGISYDKDIWVPDQLRAENIIADMVLLYWPKAAVQRGLDGAHAKLVFTAKQRTVIQDGRKIWQADYRPTVAGENFSGNLSYRNLVWGYEFTVQSAVSTP